MQPIFASSNIKLLLSLTKREFKTRYLGSILGSYWNIIHPLVMISIYTLIFSKIMKAKLGVSAGPFSYSLYLCSGLLAWNYFQESISRGTNSLLDNAMFIKKMPFPPIIVFGASLLSSAINFLIAITIFGVFLTFIQPISIGLFFTFWLVIIILSIFSFGISIAFGCLNVFFKDIQQLISVLFQLWFWFTPIVYLEELLPDQAKWLLHFNPAWAFIESLHKLLYFQTYPEAKFWLLMLDGAH
ncbi:MAG: ABC transporter permease [Bdellovibrionota bacterium]